MEPKQSENPFSAPAARISDYAAMEEGDLLSEPARLDAGRGVSWIGEAWDLYREAPGVWTGIIVVQWLIIIGMSLIPLVNIGVSLLAPVFVGGLMIGCHDLERGERLTVGHLFAAFQSHFGKLVVAGLIYLVGVVVVIMVAGLGILGTFGIGAFLGGSAVGHAPAFNSLPILLFFTVSMALILPLLMAMWFAPALIVRHDLEAMEALTLSFKGCLRNMMPFLLFAIVGLMLAIAASIPFLLGWLVLGPIMIVSQYVAYREIFVG